jgi:hypothetical protein
MTENDKIICHIFAAKGPEYVSKAQLQRGVVTQYMRVKQLLFELFCVDLNNAVFKDMDPAIRARMVKGKIEREEKERK